LFVFSYYTTTPLVVKVEKEIVKDAVKVEKEIIKDAVSSTKSFEYSFVSFIIIRKTTQLTALVSFINPIRRKSKKR
jgi:hypothetical protein